MCVYLDAASSPDYQMPASKTDHNNCKLTCDKWAVVMTTFPQQTSEAIRRLTYTDWCVLVVGKMTRFRGQKKSVLKLKGLLFS